MYSSYFDDVFGFTTVISDISIFPAISCKLSLSPIKITLAKPSSVTFLAASNILISVLSGSTIVLILFLAFSLTVSQNS